MLPPCMQLWREGQWGGRRLSRSPVLWEVVINAVASSVFVLKARVSWSRDTRVILQDDVICNCGKWLRTLMPWSVTGAGHHNDLSV